VAEMKLNGLRSEWRLVKPPQRQECFCEPPTTGARFFMTEQKRPQVFRGERMAEEIPLDFLAALALEKFQLLRGFHTLGDRSQAQAAGQLNDGADNRSVIGSVPMSRTKD